MKKVIFLLIFFITSLSASLEDKSAIVYYGEDLSYPLVGIHDYIIVQPEHINTYTHGFSLYKKNIYAYISIGEVDRNTTTAKAINTSWIVAENSAWKSDVLDIRNQKYQEFIFAKQIEPLLKRGFKNFFFDTLDSYHLYAKTMQEKKQCEQSLISFIREFHTRYPDAKLVVNRGFEIIDDIHDSINAVLFESYYKGLQGEKLEYTDVNDSSREWLDTYLNKIKSYNLDIIAVDYLPTLDGADALVAKLKDKRFIPYVSNKALDTYGKSSKNAIQREILTLVDESKLDKSLQSAHRNGATVFEYLGYIQKFSDINKNLPDPSSLHRYSGVVIWTENYVKDPEKFLKWLLELKKQHIKFVFVGNFGFELQGNELDLLGINVEKNNTQKSSIIKKDTMFDFEIDPPMSFNSVLIHVKDARKLLTYQYQNDKISTPAAITSWGGYIVDEAYLTDFDQEEIWTINPFQFFEQSLKLKKLPVADPTTENGKRLLFTHIDGDGIMNRVEGDFGEFSGDVILNQILKKYQIPHSVSIIGAEVDPNGLFPELSPQLLKITKKIFALKNVEPASHTFTHPFFWGKIVDDNLAPEYRLKVPNYQFSLNRELKVTLDNINEKYLPKNKLPKANTIFWSGDCAPRENALEFIYKHHILAINGGDTTISKIHPWMSRIAPYGIKRGDYYQVYTGAQNENVFTNDWLGPFWGFKRVTQTFELTNSPRRFKPIDIYYHLYSGSKRASLEALKYVFNWALKQDVMPIYTSEYIPKVMDMYEVSMANEGNNWLINGMKDLKTIRFEDFTQAIDMKNSQGTIGITQFENHTYVSLDQTQKHLLRLTSKDTNKIYMVSSNGKLLNYKETNTTKSYQLRSYVDLDLTMHVDKECRIKSSPKAMKLLQDGNTITLQYKHVKEATITLECK
ncbi:endo alpha-1,4 polygalactosaminidase [Sulfurimonas sp. C5]|uniref:endo alpha-1,4 polygalactosaminidase n=1 Tax=Sulfurimonas sp. C5 TaxID=3036947 RepID=UPI002454A198|nr:endo alpha-1,4 polygalactosaminidase [Sulfurimonas sp. C5]MDH4944742.1 endo alpha-1,4 polygalactosaminidase [Sulfurimonas sp. C5]